jgi:leucine dehydrogenase
MRVAQVATSHPAPPLAPVPPPDPPPGFELGFDHEQLIVRRGPRSGAEMAIAVHSTALGPALGGLRLFHYDSTTDAIDDVLRLARGMTMKAAAAGLDLGGGKGVIRAPVPADTLSWSRRREMLLDFGDLVESLDGRYITAEDVGTGTEDMVAIAERTAHVSGLPDGNGGVGDPSPFTAIGVEAAIRACVESRFGSRDLRGLGVVVIGLGHVGARLAMRLATAGARLSVTDTDVRKRDLAARLSARWLEPAEAVTASCDVLAPCALGGAISSANVAEIRAGIVCGAANNQLADDGLAAQLAQSGVLFAPDFIANAGGLINCYREICDFDEDRALELAMGIETTMREVLGVAAARGMTPLDAGLELARERLDSAVRN